MKTFDKYLHIPRSELDSEVKKVVSNADPDIKALANFLLKRRMNKKTIKGFGEMAMLELLFRLGVALNEIA